MQKPTLFSGAVVVGAALAVGGLTFGTWSASSTSAASATALEGSLLAPCCWGGTLATHDSPVATELRQEIETRSSHGETTAAIETDLVGRYGERIRAMPKAGAFSNAIVLAADAGIIGLAAMVLAVARWRRKPSDGEVDPVESDASREPDAYDARIDAELADLADR